MLVSQQFAGGKGSPRWVSNFTSSAVGARSTASISTAIPVGATCVIAVIEMDVSFLSITSMTFATASMRQIVGTNSSGLYLLMYAMDLNDSRIAALAHPGTTGTVALNLGGTTAHVTLSAAYYGGAYPVAAYLGSTLDTNVDSGTSGTTENLGTPGGMAVPTNQLYVTAFGNGTVGGGVAYNAHTGTQRISVAPQFGDHFPLLIQDATNLASGVGFVGATSASSVNWVACGAVLT